MKKHKGCVKGFYHLSKTWYGPSILDAKTVDKISIGFYHPDGGTTGEFEISWYNMAGESVPRLLVFDDGWSALANMPELVSLLESVDDQNITPDEMATKLVDVGIKDMTQREEK